MLAIVAVFFFAAIYSVFLIKISVKLSSLFYLHFIFNIQNKHNKKIKNIFQVFFYARLFRARFYIPRYINVYTQLSNCIPT